ncbi:MAG: helicase-associated domain-containing protein [Planctomycetes bacterium]|nr:helicase-associated domain-containing protein [Planctomycetota bacterium]
MQAETISLDEFLNSKSIANLQVILSFWSEMPRPWHSKSALIRDLRQLLLDDELLRKKLRKLSSRCLSLLRCLIKGTPCDTETFTWMYDVDSLAEIGLVDAYAAGAQIRNAEPGRPVFAEQIKTRIIEALAIDMRPIEDVFTLGGFLKAMPRDQYEEIVGALLKKAPRDETRQTDLELLTDPQHALDRVRSLPAQLQACVGEAVDHIGGLHRLKGIRAYKPEKLRKELESRLIGTVTELPMGYLRMDGPAIVVFTEITQALLSIPSEQKRPEAAPNVNIDALVDINTILQFLGLEGARIKQSGSVYKSSLKRLMALMCPTDAGWEPRGLAGGYLSLLCELGLAEKRRGEVVPTDEADEWLAKEPEEQLADIVGQLDELLAPMNDYAWNKLLIVLKQLSPGEALPVNKAFSRLLLLIVKDMSVGTNLAKRLYNVTSIERLLEAASSWIRALGDYGVVAVDMQQNAPHAMELTELGALALGVLEEPPPCSEADRQVLIVNPDFECIVFRHGPAWRVAAGLAHFARREKTDQTYHLKITRRHVETAVLCGMTADSMTAFLRDHSRTPIPQNIEYSINDWASKVRVARSFSAVILETHDPETLDIIMEDAKVKPHIQRRLAPTLAVLKNRISDKKLLDHLRQNGVFLRG